jgi:Fur family peroxide stress response transcriptional regulator
MAICKLLTESDVHPTATMIYDELRPQFPSLSLATIYNTLDTLVSLGAVNVLGHAGDDHVHYDAEMEPHVNLACISCHRIIDIPSDYVQQLDSEISRASGYKLLGARVLYYGLCPECQSKVETTAE